MSSGGCRCVMCLPLSRQKKKWNRKTKQTKWENPDASLPWNNTVGPAYDESGKSEMREAEVYNADIRIYVCTMHQQVLFLGG